MRKLYLLLIIFFALLCADAGAQAKQEQPTEGFKFYAPSHSHKETGIFYLDHKTGKFVLEGDMHESARAFLQTLNQMFDDYVKEKVKAACEEKNRNETGTGGPTLNAPSIEITTGTGEKINYTLQPVSGSGKLIEPKAPTFTVDTVKEDDDASCTMENLQKALRLATKDLKDPNERPPDWTSGTLILSGSHPMTVDVRTPSEKLHDEAERLEEKSRIVRWILSVRDACKGEKISLDISKSEVLTLTDAHAASHSGSSGLLIVGSNGVMTIKHSDEFKKPAKPKRRKK